MYQRKNNPNFCPEYDSGSNLKATFYFQQRTPNGQAEREIGLELKAGICIGTIPIKRPISIGSKCQVLMSFGIGLFLTGLADMYCFLQRKMKIASE